MLTSFGMIVPVLCLILFWFSIIYTSLLVLRYRKVADWYNRRAGEEIVSYFRFRSLMPLVLTAVVAMIVFVVGMFLAISDETADRQSSTDTLLWVSSLVLVCPVAWLVWRLVKAGRSEHPRAVYWRLLYDVLLNLSIGFGGSIVLVVAVGLTVLGSFTKWNEFFPNKWRDIAGVEVVPESKTHYLVAAGLSVVGIVVQFIEDGDNIAGNIFGFVAMVALGVLVWQVCRTPKENRRSMVWRWGYIIVSSYIVFIVTFWVIFIVLALCVIYLILTYVVGGGVDGKSSGGGRYEVKCENLSHDILGGSNKCRISGDTCPMIHNGRCPYQ